MIEFKRITLEDKPIFEKYLLDGNERGCEYSFANLYMWGRQRAAVVCDHLVLFSQYDRRSVYPFPVGSGDKKAVLDAIMEDAGERGIACRFTGLTNREKTILQDLYPDMFHFQCDRGFSDYVYDINDLADLKGRKFHSKRNHYNRFCDNNPDRIIEPICEANLGAVMEMADRWYSEKMQDSPDSDFEMEQMALAKAFGNFTELGMDGIIIKTGGEIVAMTMASHTSKNTIDVHFEKALKSADGAYAAINCEFACYLRDKYPETEFLNREEDMGLEGLRKAKESYRPHHMVEKCWARRLEDGYEY